MKKITTYLMTAALATTCYQANAQFVINNDSTFTTAQQMLLANELFESGEPFAEALGNNLDLLDPFVLNTPDSVAYTTGIENYEYSRYLLNTLNGRSSMGLHMMWSPAVMANAAMMPSSFDGSMTGGTPNGYKEDDMMMMMIGNFGMNANQAPPMNAWPQFSDFIQGSTYLPQTVAPDFATNYGSTRWDRSKMDKTLNLAAMGQSLQKQYFWAQDMLGAFHDGADAEVVPTGANSPDSIGKPTFDPANNIFYGGNNLDGFIGQVLTAVSINKTMNLINHLAYDGTTLGPIDPMTYDPAAGIKYFPTKIAVTESMVLAGLPPSASSQANYTVTDANSMLFDQLSYLAGTASYVNMMNPNDNSDAAHKAYHEVFDGYPFPADMATTGGAPGPYDLMKGTSKILFLNINAMHYNSTANTFVDQSSLNGSGVPVLGNTISAENAGYIIVTLTKFAQEFAGTPLQTMADNAITAQADFIIANFKDASGGYFNGFTIGTGGDATTKTLAANAAIVRGLYAAYSYTNNATYLTEANAAYNYMINNFYLPSENGFLTEMGNATATYTPWNLALFSGAMREASLVGGQTEAANIYTRVFKFVYNKMILTEAEATGESGSDSDGDGVTYIAGGTLPFVFAEQGQYTYSSVGVNEIDFGFNSFNVYPNPAQNQVSIDFNLEEVKDVRIDIYDNSGRLIQTEVATAGTQGLTLNLNNMNTGNYFVRATIDNELVAIEKLVVAK